MFVKGENKTWGSFIYDALILPGSFEPFPLFVLLPPLTHLRHLRHIVTNRLIVYVFCVTQGVTINSASHGGLTCAVKLRLGVVGAVIGGPPVAIFFSSTPQSNLRFASSPFGEPLHSLSLAFGSPAPSTGSLLVRFTSLHIKPALKGEVDFAKQKPEGL